MTFKILCKYFDAFLNVASEVEMDPGPFWRKSPILKVAIDDYEGDPRLPPDGSGGIH